MVIGLVLSQPPGYSETFFNSKIKGLQENNHEVVLFVQQYITGFSNCRVFTQPKVYRNSLLQMAYSMWLLIILIPKLNVLKRFITLERNSGSSFSKILKKIISNSHIIRVDVHWLHYGFTTLALHRENLAKAKGAKMAVSCRGYDMDVFPLKHSNPYRLIWERVDKVHTISKYMKDKAMESGMKSRTPVSIITPAIDLSKFNTTNRLLKNDVLQITTIARLHWMKGLIPTLEALAVLKQEGIQFQFQIIGSGPQYQELKFAIHQLKLKKEVSLMGQKNQTAIISRLAETNMYLQYSYSEGFCNAVLEAQAMGCLCIVSDGGALSENVLHNKTGVVVPKGQPLVLAEAIKKVIVFGEDRIQKIQKNAQERIRTTFSLEKQSESMNRFYN